jgi:hypothetical protein
MEKIMSKSNDVSTLNHRPLADSELEAVSGGRSMPNGKTDVIKAMGHMKWSDVEILPGTR